jgi:hypothetical protein
MSFEEKVLFCGVVQKFCQSLINQINESKKIFIELLSFLIPRARLPSKQNRRSRQNIKQELLKKSFTGII